jgi:hypothetical protein
MFGATFFASPFLVGVFGCAHPGRRRPSTLRARAIADDLDFGRIEPPDRALPPIVSVHIRKARSLRRRSSCRFRSCFITIGYFVSAIGPDSYSIHSWAGIGNWTGVHWAAADEIRAGAAVGIGAAAGVFTLLAGRARKAIAVAGHTPSPAR